jgi:hypothetical protein
VDDDGGHAGPAAVVSSHSGPSRPASLLTVGGFYYGSG